jgi:hypothetical protein
VRVSWEEGLKYPVVVDPAWTTTGNLAVGRSEHTASLLEGNKVLVVGGQGTDATACPGGRCRTSEVWSGGSFSAGGSLEVGRYAHTASVLTSGSVLIAGGSGSDAVACPGSYCKTGEIWKNGVFSSSGSLLVGRRSHTASVLANDTVLIVGGLGSGPDCADGYANCRSSELWNKGAFSASGSLVVGRSGHTASVLSDGSVFVAGGSGNLTTCSPSGYCSTSEVWSNGSFVSSGSLAVGRAYHTASLLTGDKILVTGGSGDDVTRVSPSCGQGFPTAYTA